MREGDDYRSTRRSVLRLGVAGIVAGMGYSTSAAATHRSNGIVISGRGLDGDATYEFTVSGDLAVADDPSGDRVDGQTASGRVSSWKDGYTFSGEITDFSYEGNLEVYINGSEVDPDSLGSGTGSGSDLVNDLRVIGVGERATYRFTVSGGLEPGPDFDTDGTDSISGSSGAGTVGGTSGDDYTFSGEITDFSHEGPLEVRVNGERVDPDSFANGGDGDGSDDDGTNDGTETRTLTFEGSPGGAYEFSVSGSLEKSTAMGASINSGDEISGQSADGGVGGGRDSYTYSGEITAFRVDDGVRVYLDGSEVDPDALGGGSGGGSDGDGGTVRELIVSDPDGSQPNDYEFTVTGTVEALDDPRGDHASGDSARGTVYGGRDGYRFTGEVTSFTYDGEIDVTIDGQGVDPATLGNGTDGSGSALERTIVIRGIEDEHVDYDLTVSGSLDKSTAMGGSINSGDEISGSGATGFVFGGTDSYVFSGEVTAFGYSGGEIEVFVDGSQVDPDALGDSSGDESDDGSGGTDSTELIVADPDGSQPNDYRFVVTGTVEALDDPRGDHASGDSARGTVYGGRDGYRFTGEITSFTADGEVVVFLDGERVDPDTLGDDSGGSGETTTITFEGSPGGAYEFSVTGSLEKSTAMGASINSGDEISGSSAGGGVGGGRDSYAFTGELERLRVDDGVTVYLDGNEIDPDGSSSAGGTWSEGTRLPREQTAAGGGVVDGKLYYFGGFDSGQGLAATSRAFVYDPSTSGDSWSRIESMPRALWAPCGVSTGLQVFSFGGAPADSPYRTGDPPSDEIFVYTPGSGWTDLTAETGVRCPHPNWAMNGVYNPDDGLIYCVGGATNVTDRESATDHGVTSDNPGKYDESRIWTFDPDSQRVVDPDLARLPEAKRWPSVALVDVDGSAFIHALGGWRGTVGPTATNFRLDPSTGRVTRKRSVPRAGTFATDTNPVVDDQIYLTHGRFRDTYSTVSYRYDPAFDTFSADVPRPEHVRGRAVDAVIDGTLYVIGGHVKRSDGYHQATTYNEVYTPPR